MRLAFDCLHSTLVTRALKGRQHVASRIREWARIRHGGMLFEAQVMTMSSPGTDCSLSVCFSNQAVHLSSTRRTCTKLFHTKIEQPFFYVAPTGQTFFCRFATALYQMSVL